MGIVAALINVIWRFVLGLVRKTNTTAGNSMNRDDCHDNEWATSVQSASICDVAGDHAVARITFPASSDLFEGLGQINYVGESGYTDDHSTIFFQSRWTTNELRLSKRWLDMYLPYRAFLDEGILYFERYLREGTYKIYLSDRTRPEAEEEVVDGVIIEHSNIKR